MKEVRKYIESDYYRIWGNVRDAFYIIVIKAILNLNPAFTFAFWFRLAQHHGWYRRISICMYRHYCNKYNIYMPLNVEVGYGLYMGHCMCMVIAGGTKIGNNCNLSQFLNIGSNGEGRSKIGDNVYIGPHVCIVEDVVIKNNVTIGAGSIVIKDIQENATVVGNPARLISTDNPGRFIKNQFEQKR